MSVPASYLIIILIWSTTPLAIKWSSDGSGFLFALLSRMFIGALLCLLLIKVLRIKLPWHRQACRVYAAAGLGIYGAMISVYWGAQYIPSGMISVVFGLSPIITGVLASIWLNERGMTVLKVSGMVFGLVGLVLIFGTSFELGSNTAQGIAAVLLATLLHSISAVWLKSQNSSLPAVSITGGALLLVLPLYLLTWLIFDGSFPIDLPQRTSLSIIYLGVFGSVIGFVLYFYVLKRMEISRIVLITLVTPVLALIIGQRLNGETIGLEVWLGTIMILSGLLLYQWDSITLRIIKNR